jgi:hypothetical protein
MKKRILDCLLAGIIVLSFSGCVVYSDNPLTDPGEQDIDSSIIGTWFWREKNETGYLHIGLDEDLKALRIVMVDFDEDGELDTSQFAGHTSSLGENKYLNLFPSNDPGGYMLVKYSVNKNTFGIAMMSTDAVKEAINSGLLSGEVRKDKWSSSIRITEEKKRLQQFIIRNDKTLFPETKYLEKLHTAGNPVR